MRCGGRMPRSTAVAAAASGGATTAPSAIAGAQGMSGINVRVDAGDGHGRETDGEDDQAGNRRPVVFEISRRCVVGRVEQYGCNEERQREFRRDGERRRAGKEREERAAEGQEYRIRCSGTARRCRQENGGEEQADESFEFPHVVGTEAIQ